MHILVDGILSFFKDVFATAITSCRNHRDLKVLPTVNNPRPSKSLMLANRRDAISDKRYLQGKRNFELVLAQVSLFEAVKCHQERG